MIDFTVSYQEILNKVNEVDPIEYAKTRNYIQGAVTYLSPYISRGVISTKQIMDAVIANGYSFSQYEKFLQELAWREYFQRVWQEKGDLINSDVKQPQAHAKHQLLPQAILDANTGIEAIDLSIKELYDTGYMHNHLRMYTASVTCNIANAGWKQPARWMYYHLLDGDVASNQCSWQWVAGAFSSKKYYCNQENINKYTRTLQRDTFLDQSYESLLSTEIPGSLLAATELSLTTTLPITPLPNLETHKPTLIYNSYNLDPLWRNNEDVNRILLLEPSHFKQYPVSNKVVQFIIALSANIPGIQLYCGEIEDLYGLYGNNLSGHFIFKEHPAFTHYKGVSDNRTWLFPDVKGFYPSFFNYWKKCGRSIKR